MRDKLSLDDTNWLCLSRHYLIKKAKNADLLKVVHDICGLNAQGALTVNLSLWNRIENFDRNRLEEALYEKKTLVKTWCMRGTVHVIPSEDFPVYVQALRERLRIKWENFLKRRGISISKRKRKAIKNEILNLLSGKTLTRNEICRALGLEAREEKILVSRLLRELSYEGLVCHAKPLGPWYHFREYRFARVDNWLPKLDIDAVRPQDAKRKLLLWYFSSYGPASLQDFAYWTDLPVKEVKMIFDLVKDSLVQVEIEGLKGDFWLPEESLKILENKPLSYFSVCLLPPFDPLIMGHKEKSRIMDLAYKKEVFLPLADVAATVMVNGFVVGTWKFRRRMKNPIIEVRLFRRLDEKVVDAINLEIEQIIGFLEVENVEVKIDVLHS